MPIIPVNVVGGIVGNLVAALPTGTEQSYLGSHGPYWRLSIRKRG